MCYLIVDNTKYIKETSEVETYLNGDKRPN